MFIVYYISQALVLESLTMHYMSVCMLLSHFGVIWHAISDLEHAPLYAIFPPCHALVELHFCTLSLVNALCMHS